MNLPGNLKLKTSTKLLLWILSIPGVVAVMMINELVKDSSHFLALKQSKPIDALLNAELLANIAPESILIALLFLSLFFNLFLYKRMNLYSMASDQYSELFFNMADIYTKLTSKTVTIRINEYDFIISANSCKKIKSKQSK